VVRSLAARALRDFGYTIIEAADGRQALDIYERREADIALVVTDVAMPEIGGRELAARLHERAPELPILFMSGYTGEEVTERGMLPLGAPFQSKPFAPDALASRVRHLLDKAAAGVGAQRVAPRPAAAIPTNGAEPAGPRQPES
jgi:CheY-like chemotaxis protein